MRLSDCDKAIKGPEPVSFWVVSFPPSWPSGPCYRFDPEKGTWKQFPAKTARIGDRASWHDRRFAPDGVAQKWSRVGQWQRGRQARHR